MSGSAQHPLPPEDFADELNAQLTYLIAFARRINELDLTASLFGEFRGAQDVGWSTTQTAFEVFNEMRDLGARPQGISIAQYRQMLCLYTHLAEAGGVYESLMNMMGVVQLKPYNLWPFQHLVRVKKTAGRIIGPNANAMFRRLAELALTIGMVRLAELLEVAFSDDVRNGIAHADYILGPDGLRLRRRNGGTPYVVSHAEVNDTINTGLFFFDLLQQHINQVVHSFRPAREIIGRFSLNPPMLYVVELKENGAFSISTSSPGRQTDAAYDRQAKINDRLGGRVFMAYATVPEAWVPLLDDLRAEGFDVTVVEMAGDQLTALEDEIERDGLWSLTNPPRQGGLLLAAPHGFCRLGSIDDFRAMLPPVEALEVTAESRS